MARVLSGVACRAAAITATCLLGFTSLRLSTPNATWQMARNPNRRSASCRSTAPPSLAAASSRSGRKRRRRCTSRTPSVNRRSERDKKACDASFRLGVRAVGHRCCWPLGWRRLAVPKMEEEDDGQEEDEHIGKVDGFHCCCMEVAFA